ncbi:MAG: pyruvate formate lyase family protein [Armatimonadota bacterium]
MVLASTTLLAEMPPDNARFHLRLWEEFARQPDYLSWHERYARAMAAALAAQPVYLFPDERLVGMVYHLGPWDVPEHFAQLEDPVGRYAEVAARQTRLQLPDNAELVQVGAFFTDGAFPGHVSWHWDWVLKKGIAGLLADYHAALAYPLDSKAAEFYRNAILLLEAVLQWNDRHIAALETAWAQADPDDRPRLAALLELCRRVPAQPAATFHEAVQSFYFHYLAVMRENPYGGNSPGRLDYYLWPYLERDLAVGRCTPAEARALIDELFQRIDARIHPLDGWVETIVVGGCHPDGTPSVNPLSTLMVESIMALDQTHPAVYLRMPEQPPPEFIDLAVRYLLHGKNRAQIMNDAAILPAMTGYGMPRADAAMYTCGGCMELVPQGMNSDLLFAAVHNVPKVVELTLTGGQCLRTGQWLSVSLPSITAYRSFEDLYAAFAAELERELHILFRRLDIYSVQMAAYRPTFLLSTLTADCLLRGREQQDDGARYHDYGATPLGLANAADALYAVKRAVYEDGLCTAGVLLSALHANFQGYEDLQARLRALPRYGQQHPGADGMMERVLATLTGCYADYRNRLGGRVKPIVFTFVWAPEAGAHLGATACGDPAGTPVAHGLTPQSSAMTEGLTAAIGSHTALSLRRVAGGAGSMWDLDPAWATPDTVRTLLTTFLELGGQIFQGNTTDVCELQQAQAHPQDYPHLFVRVGGFSARFTSLDPAVQQEIVERYRHRG